jgi:GntR family transcriptional regulator of vanillate catabolism
LHSIADNGILSPAMANFSSPQGKAVGVHRLSDLAYSKLRYAISEGQIPAGTRLVELELTRTLSMGRTPIHDALVRLVGDGLIESVPNAGFFVRHLTLEDVEMNYEIRAALEGLAVRVACRRGFSDMKLLEMEHACDLMAEAHKNNDPRASAQADFHFHQALIALANSQRLEAAIRASHMLFLTWSRSVPAETYLKVNAEVLEEHRAIVEALRQRNSVEAERLLQDSFIRNEGRLRWQVRSANMSQVLRKVSVLGEFGQYAPPSEVQK